MLLPKRVVRRMKTHMTEDEIDARLLRGYIEMMKTEDRYFLDGQNVIVVINNDGKTEHNESYIVIHERLVDKRLVEINRWYMNGYYFGAIHNITVIKDLNLFQVQNGSGNFNALYDYKQGKFVVPRKKWGVVSYKLGNVNYLTEYNGFIAVFGISSDYEHDDCYSYINPVTNKKIVESFSVNDGDYYAILNLDGSIRGNKLFKGSSFSKIEKIIDLDEYESLEAFKSERKQLCNEEKKKRKQQYYQLIGSRNNGSLSPYYDEEVLKTLQLKK